jgi:ribosomal protein S18 acetylase RimI-like enzyme
MNFAVSGGPIGRQVRKARSDEVTDLSRALAQAFFEDPTAAYIVPDTLSRLNILGGGFELFLRRVWLHHGEIYAVGEPAVGVCIWNPPGAWKVSVSKQLSILPALIRESDHPSEPHYYLPFVGVEPDSQGRGLGSALMHPVLSRCDADEMAAYLEASTLRNRALYERHGFKVTNEFKAGRGAPTMWRMWRTPSRAT